MRGRKKTLSREIVLHLLTTNSLGIEMLIDTCLTGEMRREAGSRLDKKSEPFQSYADVVAAGGGRSPVTGPSAA